MREEDLTIRFAKFSGAPWSATLPHLSVDVSGSAYHLHASPALAWAFSTLSQTLSLFFRMPSDVALDLKPALLWDSWEHSDHLDHLDSTTDKLHQPTKARHGKTMRDLEQLSKKPELSWRMLEYVEGSDFEESLRNSS